MRWSLPSHLGIYAIVLLSVLFIGIGVLLAVRFQDAHLIARSGAAVEALTALVGLAQFRRDEGLKVALGSVEDEANRVRSQQLDIVGPTTADMAAREVRAYYERLAREERQRLLFIVVFGTVVGVLIHGFGDLLGIPLGISARHLGGGPE